MISSSGLIQTNKQTNLFLGVNSFSILLNHRSFQTLAASPGFLMVSWKKRIPIGEGTPRTVRLCPAYLIQKNRASHTQCLGNQDRSPGMLTSRVHDGFAWLPTTVTGSIGATKSRIWRNLLCGKVWQGRFWVPCRFVALQIGTAGTTMYGHMPLCVSARKCNGTQLSHPSHQIWSPCDAKPALPTLSTSDSLITGSRKTILSEFRKRAGPEPGQHPQPCVDTGSFDPSRGSEFD